jgi:CubicO group peptidase (beta-lactamase class C family)
LEKITLLRISGELKMTSFMLNNWHKSLMTIAVSLILSTGVQADSSWPRQEAGAAAAGLTNEGVQALDAAMEKIVADQDVAGMAWILAKDGEVNTFETAGLARVDDQASMQMDSLFRIYSMPKPVTGVALMILHEQGLWDFDDPVSKHVPELANLRIMSIYNDEGEMELVSAAREPNMRELLNHSTGFGYGLGVSDPVNNKFRDTKVLASSDLDDLNRESCRYTPAVSTRRTVVIFDRRAHSRQHCAKAFRAKLRRFPAAEHLSAFRHD